MQATRWTQGGHRHGQQQPHFDVTMWLADMDDEVLQYGQQFVCAKIYAGIFQPYHPWRVEYLGIASRFKTMMTTGPGCWNCLKKLLERRSSLDALAAEARDRERLPGETYVDFAVQKIYLVQCVVPNLGVGMAIAMVKRKLDWQDAELCRERVNIDDFISELLECDNRRARAAARRQSQAARSSPRGHGQAPSKAMPPASSKAMPPASSKAMPPAARTATPTAAAAAEHCQSLHQSLKSAIREVLLEFKEEITREYNNHARYHHHPQCEEATTKYDEEPEQPDESIKKYDGELNVDKHQEQTTMDEPEQPDEPKQPDEIIRTTNDGELRAASIQTKNDGELHAESTGTAEDGELHAESIGTTNDRDLQAEKHQRLTVGITPSGALNAPHLKKEVISALTLWFAPDGCCDDEPRDGIG
jgi:hypothetical protein